MNDSKSTTVQSTLAALRQFRSDKKIHLILGGKDKGDDFSRIRCELRPNDFVWIYGISRQKILEGLGSIPCGYRELQNFDDLIREMMKVVQPGEVVLLSPAATSWDQFANFEERGKRFWQLIGKSSFH